MKRATRCAAILPFLVLWLTGLASVAPSSASADVSSAVPLPLWEFVPDHQGGRIWSAYDQTSDAGGPTVIGQPSTLSDPADGLVHIFVHSASGDLVEFVNDNKTPGQTWSTYDISTSSGGPSITGDPDSLYDPTKKLLRVFAESSSGDLVQFTQAASGGSWSNSDLTAATGTSSTVSSTPNAIVIKGVVHVYVRSTYADLLEYVNDDAGGRPWNVYDQTLAAGAGWIGSAAYAVVIGGAVHVYLQGANGDLIEYVNDGAFGRVWNAYDQSIGAGGGVPLGGRPVPLVVNGFVHVFVRSAGGDLVECIDDHQNGHVWNCYDQTLGAGGGEQIAGSPSPESIGGVTHVYVRSSYDHLLEYVADGLFGHIWNVYDQTEASDGPMIGFDPGVVIWGGIPHVYAGGAPVVPTIDDIVQVAESQDQYGRGVVETPLGSNCNPYTAYFGRGSTAGCAPGTAAEEWCSDFAQWVWTQVGIDTSGITGWSYTFVDWGLNHGTFKLGSTDNPQPGDAVVWGSTASAYGAHVALVVGVSQGQIDVVAGNSGPPIDPQGDVAAVWDSGYFDPATSTVDGYPIVGYISPINWSGLTPHAVVPVPQATPQQIATQDGGH